LTGFLVFDGLRAETTHRLLFLGHAEEQEENL
jgi:hypothetical protein